MSTQCFTTEQAFYLAKAAFARDALAFSDLREMAELPPMRIRARKIQGLGRDKWLDALEDIAYDFFLHQE